MKENLSAEIYLAAKKLNLDVPALLKVISLMQQADLAQVLADYQQFKQGTIKIAQVISSTELSVEQQQKIITKVKQQLSQEKLRFVFEINNQLPLGLEIWIADDKISLAL
ncbi:MAG: F0F1 ATP synthase subunit delta [bacterium]